MKKFLSIFLLTLLVLVSFAATTKTVGNIFSLLVLEKSSFEVSGKVKEVVMGIRGNGYALITSDSTDIRIPLLFANPTAVKVGSDITVNGSKVSFVIPLYFETSGYKIQIRHAVKQNTETTTLEFKVKDIQISKNSATIVLVDSMQKEYTIPAQIIPIWKNLRAGDSFKVVGIKRTVELPETILIDGKTYHLGTGNIQFGKYFGKDYSGVWKNYRFRKPLK
ncbi:MAG: hypothetical protein ACP5PP_07090 [Fervidobacterium sp.]